MSLLRFLYINGMELAFKFAAKWAEHRGRTWPLVRVVCRVVLLSCAVLSWRGC